MNKFPINDTCLVALDFETADFGKDSACAIGMVKIKQGIITDKFYSLIRPPRTRVCFTHVHGLTWAMLKNSPSFAEIWTEINTFLQDADGIIAHNASFDKGVLYGTCLSYNITAPIYPFYCTLKASRQNLKLAKNKLSDVCSALQIKLDHHNAISDANAAAEIFLYCARQGYDLQKCKASA